MDPFIARLDEQGDVIALLTAPNETLPSLTIKYQVVHTVLPNLNTYQAIRDDGAESKMEWDLTKLPLGVCNATARVEEGQNEVEVSIETFTDTCQTYNLGGGQLTPDSRFYLATTFTKDEGKEITLKERQEHTNVTIGTTENDQKAVLDYQYRLVFTGFEDVNQTYFKMENITVKRYKLLPTSECEKMIYFYFRRLTRWRS